MPAIFITGANRGIGLGLAAHYVAQGWHVFAACRQPEQASALHEAEQHYPGLLTLVALDVTADASIDTAWQQVSAKTTHLDVLINNAGVLHPSAKADDLTAVMLREAFAVNTIAPFMVARRFGDLLHAGAKLVNITMPTQPITRLVRRENHAYVASRYALNALTKMLALEWAERGIISVGLYPGYLQTDMNQHAAAAKPLTEGIPLVANVIATLTAEHNGLCLLPDGKAYEW